MSIVGNSTTRVTSGALGNKTTTSIAGVPGSGLPSAYARVDLDVKLAATDTGALYMALSNGYVRQTNMSNDTDNDPWKLFLKVSTDPFTLTIPAQSGHVELWGHASDSIANWPWWAGSLNLDFTGDTTFPTRPDLTDEASAAANGYYKLPFSISDVTSSSSISGGVTTTTSEVYINLPILYQWTNNLTSPITLSATKVTLDTTSITDYFPFAIRKSGVMRTCNRSGGKVGIRKSGAFRDARCSEASGYDSKAFGRKSGSWVVAPRIGA